jgi:transposase InsO family protein
VARAGSRCRGGLQNALWSLGGAPLEHRTDSLSAAFNNLAEQEELTRRYDELSERYGMRATRNNPGASHENGSIESRQGTVKRAIDQALLLRGSREFTRLSEYRSFVAEVAARLNSRVIKALTIERACLQALPQLTCWHSSVHCELRKWPFLGWLLHSVAV